MTPDEWNQYWRECWLTPHDLEQLMVGRTVTLTWVSPGGVVKWLQSGERSAIEHLAVVGYYDHLYAQELGIQYP